METTAVTVSANELKQKIQNNEDIVLIDALSRESFCSIHIPASINIPTNQVNEYAESVLPDKHQNLVVYCMSTLCRKSAKAAELLGKLGYENVSHFAGGLKEWKESGNELAGSGEDGHLEC